MQTTETLLYNGIEFKKLDTEYPTFMLLNKDYALLLASCACGLSKYLKNVVFGEMKKAETNKLIILGGCCDYDWQCDQLVRAAIREEGFQFRWRLKDVSCAGDFKNLVDGPVPKGTVKAGSCAGGSQIQKILRVPNNWKSAAAWLNRHKTPVLLWKT